MELEIDPSGDTRTLTLDGALTIERAAELKERLIGSMEGVSQVVVKLEDVTEVDLTCLQLLCSAHRTASESGKQLTLMGENTTVLRKTAQSAGFADKTACKLSPNENCLWVGGNR